MKPPMIAAVAALALAACKESPRPETTKAPPAPVKTAPVKTAPAPAGKAPPVEIALPADFAPQVAKQITADNYKQALDALADEINE